MGATDDYVKKLETELIRKEAEKEAIRAEFQETIKSGEEVTPDKLRKSIEKMLPDALATMQELLSLGENDSLRWSIAKFVISTKLVDNKGVEGADVFKDLLQQFSN